MARSWLLVGEAILPDQASAGSDIVILKRGDGDQPGANVINAPGHVGFFAGWDIGKVCILGGNQSNSVNNQLYDGGRILGVRRLY
jgi:hypothetical protein